MRTWPSTPPTLHRSNIVLTRTRCSVERSTHSLDKPKLNGVLHIICRAERSLADQLVIPRGRHNSGDDDRRRPGGEMLKRLRLLAESRGDRVGTRPACMDDDQPRKRTIESPVPPDCREALGRWRCPRSRLRLPRGGATFGVDADRGDER